MRLIFAGTPQFAAVALARLADAGHDITLVLTQPDRPAGRGMRPVMSAVKQTALARAMPLDQPERLHAEVVERMRALRADALIVAAYGLLLPQSALDAAVHGAWNIHASLLPRWRGAAPIQRALLAGDSETGVSIMKMDAGLDTGAVLAQRRVSIADDDAGSLHDKLAALGAEMMTDALTEIAAGTARPQPQPAVGITYARKIEKREALLDWMRPAVELERAVRAFNPSPGAGTLLHGEPVKIWRAQVAQGCGQPGELLLGADGDLAVACGEASLQILELQRAGGKRLDAAQFLRGRPLERGARFG